MHRLLLIPLAVAVVSSLLACHSGERSEEGLEPPVQSEDDPAPPSDAVPNPDEPTPTYPDPGTPGEPDPAPTDPESPADPLAAVPPCVGSIHEMFSRSAMQPPLAGSNGYRVPSEPQMLALETSIRSFLAGDGVAAVQAATSAEYLLCRGTLNESSLVLWRPPAGSGQAQFMLRTGAVRGAIFEAPHTIFDSGTLEQSMLLFSTLKARALIVAGAHRCASSTYSGCSGSTSVCGSSEPFRVSDMAHTEQSHFQVAHRVLSEAFTQDWVISVHGMGASGVSVSDGTDSATTPDAPSAKLASALAARFSGVTTCNAFGGVPYESRLCGTTNTQGRHLNGSANACTSSSKTSSRRFIHMEQSKDVRNAAATVAEAFDTVLP